MTLGYPILSLLEDLELNIDIADNGFDGLADANDE